MKTLSSGLTTELAKKTAATPVWILKLTVATVDYYLSDAVHIVAGWNGGVTTLPWVTSWGRLREAISGSLGEIRVGDFDCTLMADPDATTDAIDLALDSTLEKSTATLYLWAAGLSTATAPPVAMFAGYVRDVSIPDELTVNLVIEDAATRLQNLNLGVVINATTWSKADPDDIGKIIPIVYGVAKNIPAPALYAGKLTSLDGAVTSSATSISFVDPTGITTPMTVKVESEEIRLTAGSGNPYTCTRGYNSTTAAAHVDGSMAVEVVSSPYVFACADAPVTSIDRVLCRTGEGRDIDVTDLCTRYTGTGADDYTGYTDRAVVTITAAQAASILARVQAALGLVDPGHIHGRDLVISAVEIDDYVHTVGAPYFPEAPIDGNFNTGALFGNADETSYYRVIPPSINGTPTRIRACVKCGADGYTGRIHAKLYVGGTYKGDVLGSGNSATAEIIYTSWYTITTVAEIYAANTYIHIEVFWDPASSARLWQIWYEVESDPSTETTTTGITAGNSAADLALGGRIIVDVTRSITAPDLVIADILTRYCGGLSSSKVGSFPAGYRIDGVMLEAKPALEVLARIAFESRAWFRLVAGAGVVTVRPSTLTSARTLAACRLGSDNRKVHARKKAAIDDVLNKIVMRYNRDNDKSGDADENWLAVLTSEDGTSQTDYGIRQRDDLFKMLWVTDATHAASVAAFYLLFYKRRRWRHEFEVFLDQADLEFGDIVTLGFAGNAVGEITEAGYQPGSTASIDTIALVVEA